MNETTARNLFCRIEQAKEKELRDDLYRYAIRYARTRADWHFYSEEERRQSDRSRTRLHNALIDACNILCRAMVAAGEDVSWREELGDDRREIGDLACYIHCFLGLAMR